MLFSMKLRKIGKAPSMIKIKEIRPAKMSCKQNNVEERQGATEVH